MRRSKLDEETDSLATRGERKQRTRARLLAAALDLMRLGRGFTGLGLREVAREAGVVPTAFYRHFEDMNQLGLALVDDGGLTLRQLLREARQSPAPLTDVIRNSVLIYRKFVEVHGTHFLFIAGERFGGSPVLRRAIRMEVNRFAGEMAQDLRRLNSLPRLSTPMLEVVCGLIVTTMLNAATDILDLPPRQPRAEKELIENFVSQLRLIFLGAMAWRESPRGTGKKVRKKAST